MALPVTRQRAWRHYTALHALAVKSRQLYFQHTAAQTGAGSPQSGPNN